MDFNFEDLSGVLELVGDAGSATGRIAKGIETVKTLFKKAKSGTDADLKLALSELTMEVANAQMANSDLKLKLMALQEELAKMQAFQSDLDRYELWETPTGAIVYRMKQDRQGSEPMHYLCPGCIEDRHKSILQGHKEYRKCPRCTTGYTFAEGSGFLTSQRSNPFGSYRF